MYQRASIIDAVKTKIALKKNVASIEINCEYTAVNQIKILGLMIAIVNPCKNEFT